VPGYTAPVFAGKQRSDINRAVRLRLIAAFAIPLLTLLFVRRSLRMAEAIAAVCAGYAAFRVAPIRRRLPEESEKGAKRKECGIAGMRSSACLIPMPETAIQAGESSHS
jgi:hypothetical protein